LPRRCCCFSGSILSLVYVRRRATAAAPTEAELSEAEARLQGNPARLTQRTVLSSAAEALLCPAGPDFDRERTDMQYETITREDRDGAAIVTLRRPT
jgi:hypothetical protein